MSHSQNPPMVDGYSGLTWQNNINELRCSKLVLNDMYWWIYWYMYMNSEKHTGFYHLFFYFQHQEHWSTVSVLLAEHFHPRWQAWPLDSRTSLLRAEVSCKASITITLLCVWDIDSVSMVTGFHQLHYSQWRLIIGHNPVSINYFSIYFLMVTREFPYT